MRQLSAVITEMMFHIPNTPENADFLDRLEWNRTDASYRAPEDHLGWELMQETIMDYLAKPDSTWTWQWHVLSVWTTLPWTELKNMWEEGLSLSSRGELQ